jgi:regulator of RNase E activity RraA
VDDALLERMKKVTIEEAFEQLSGVESVIPRAAAFGLQFEGGWKNLHPDRPIVGRAVTGRYVPLRQDLELVMRQEGERNKYGKAPAGHPFNSWLISSLVTGDVPVIEMNGKVEKGTFIGDNLGTAIARNTGGTGLVVDGGIRDTPRVSAVQDLNVVYRDAHPSGIGDITMVEMNGPVRIGGATALPGDIVLATSSGVIFIPPQHARMIVEASEQTRLRDYYGKQEIAAGRWMPGAVDTAWSEEMEAKLAQWLEETDTTKLEF